MSNSATQEMYLYSSRLKRRIQELLHTHGQMCFCDLVKQCEGAFPSDVLLALKELGDSSLTGASLSTNTFIPDIKEPDPGSILELLPEPHPADFDWRFHGNSRRFLTELLVSRTSETSKILLLCAPTLLCELHNRGRNAALIDHNQATANALSVTGHLSTIVADIFTSDLPLPQDTFDICVMDPPWYPEHYRSCLIHAAKAVRLDGTLLMSLLPPLTRPTAIADRRAILQEALLLGFDIVSLLPSRLLYEVPPFEQATLNALEIHCASWRRGDLLELRKTVAVSPSRTSEMPAEKWQTFVFGRTQVKLRHRKGKLTGFSADPLDGQKTLLSVSRRFPHRDQIDVWNSRNIAYSVSNVEPLRIALAALEKKKPLEEAISDASTASALSPIETEQLARVLKDVTDSLS
jgi:hypothetical protein